MSRRSPFAAVAVLVVVACSVYGPGDLVGPDTNPFPTLSGGQAGASSLPSYGGYSFGGSAHGGVTSGGYRSGGSTGGGSGGRGGSSATSASGGSSARGGATGAGGHANSVTGGSESTGGARTSGGRQGSAGGSPSRGGSKNETSGGSAMVMGGAAGDNAGGASGGPSTGGSPSAGGGGSPSTGGAPPAPPELIDNMEDGNAYILKNDGRDGTWYTAFGMGGSADPPAASITMPLLGSDVAVAGSKRGFHFTADGGEDWGALCGFDFIYVAAGKPKLPYDASRYKGVTFWIKGVAAASIVVRIPLKDTSADAKGKCTAIDDACENHFKTSIDITTSWQKVSLPWGAPKSVFEQEPWGYTLPAFDPSQVIALQFLVSPGESAEFWLDDVSLIPP